MKINKIKFRDMFLPTLLWLILVAFGAGYTTNEFFASEYSVQVQKQFYKRPSPKEEMVSVCFPPNKQCQRKIIGEINKAKRLIHVQGYNFTDWAIGALVATARGVNLQVLLDKSNSNNKLCAKDVIIQNNLPLRFGSPSEIAQNKVAIIDQSVVLSGAYNFSTAAYTRNTENLLILPSPDLAAQYIPILAENMESIERKVTHSWIIS